jgi:hypothetical protein
MYPSVNALLGTWRLLGADQLKPVDVTKRVRKLLTDPELLNQCLTRELWRAISVTLVELEPDGDVLPVRAEYDPATHGFGIGVNPLTYAGRLWYALPDVIAAAILNPTEGRTAVPRIHRAIRLVPNGQQPGLHPIRLRGQELIDPYSEDPFVRMIEERQRVLRDPTLDDHERERLSRFLKITANATAYGVLARFDRREHDKKTDLTVYGPDDEPIAGAWKTPEDPGPFCFPPVAASITAGARLMLALLERLLHDHGGHYAFCDTDSMAIVASPRGATIPCNSKNGDKIHALPWKTVKQILARFDELNPYDRNLVPSPWKVEAESLTKTLHCYAISAKRYCLYRISRSGRPQIVAAIDHNNEPGDDTDTVEEALEDWSEHGLGLYLDPTADHTGKTRRDNKGRRLWVAEAWQWILDDAHNRHPRLPNWAASFALTQFTVSNPTIENWFKGYNATQPESDSIRPGSFGLMAHPIEIGQSSGPLPASTYERDPSRWPELGWYDRRTGQPLNIIAGVVLIDPETRTHALARGDIQISLLGEVLAQYRRRIEHKSLAPDGTPTGPDTHGLLQRRPVTSGPLETELIGKEGNKLEERQTGETREPDDYRNSYGRRGDAWSVVLTVLKEVGGPAIARETGFSRSTVYAVLAGSRPRAAHSAAYEQLALRFASEHLETWEHEPPTDGAVSILSNYLTEREKHRKNVSRCEWCTKPIAPERCGDTRMCSTRCRTAAGRARASYGG